MISGLILSFLLMNTPPQKCEFREKDFPLFELQFGSSKSDVEVAAPDAKLILCEVWKEFPNLLITQVDMGGAGTYAISHETDLAIYDLSKNQMKEVFRKTIRVESSSQNKKTKNTEKIISEKLYRLEKTNKGEPSIRWLKSSKVDILRNRN